MELKVVFQSALQMPGWMVPDVADARWCLPRRLHGQPQFYLTSVRRRSSGLELEASIVVRGLLTPVVDNVGFLARLSVSSVGFRFHLLCSRNSSMDGGAAVVV
jgi:hypothetical protein